MCRRRGVRADLGAGLAKWDEGGMMIRGDSGFERLLLVVLSVVVTLRSDTLDRVES